MSRHRFSGVFLAIVCAAVSVRGEESVYQEGETHGIRTPGAWAYLSPLADLDRDQNLDFISGKEGFWGRGDGSFEPVLLFEEAVAAFGFGDADGDGFLDLLALSPWYTEPTAGEGETVREFQVRRNTQTQGGPIGFPAIHKILALNPLDPPVEEPFAVYTAAAFGDVNGDSLADAVLTGIVFHIRVEDGVSYKVPEYLFLIALANADGTYADPVPISAANHGEPWEIILADVNGDGSLDIISALYENWTSYAGTVMTLLNDGKGSFGPLQMYDTVSKDLYYNPQPTHVATHDTDQDGDLDFIVGHNGTPGFTIMTNQSEGLFETGRLFQAGYYAEPWEGRRGQSTVQWAEVGDFDGDETIDALYVDKYRMAVQWNLLNSDLRTEVPLIDRFPDPSQQMSQLRTGDVNNDGLTDVVVNGRGCDSNFSVPCNVVVLTGTRGKQFLRGDSNQDSGVNISDMVAILGYLFRGTGTTTLTRCLDRADTDDNGEINVTDAVYLLLHLFVSGPPLPPPGSVPMRDPTPDGHLCD